MLVIGKHLKRYQHPLTRKEIVEYDFPEEWDMAKKYVQTLAHMQTEIIEQIKKSKNLLPQKYEELKGKDAQMRLLNYIRLCSIYSLASELFAAINDCCINLADASNSRDRVGIDDAKHQLAELSKANLNIYITDEVSGFMRLCNLYVDMKRKINIIGPCTVFRFYSCSWALPDIIGTINGYGLCCESLWEAAVRGSCPNSVIDVEMLLNDDEIVRIY